MVKQFKDGIILHFLGFLTLSSVNTGWSLPLRSRSRTNCLPKFCQYYDFPFFPYLATPLAEKVLCFNSFNEFTDKFTPKTRLPIPQ